MRNVLDESYSENEDTNCVSNNLFFEDLAAYEVMSKNLDRRQLALQYGAWALHAG